ncbi:MAG TPA: hypothetical protein VFX80_10735, partial [Solirubrobacteraceae bacterium]|nr:hypothetical protein [Solirubrobacteraceae bacterium]
AAPASPLEELRQEIKREVHGDPIVLEVPGRAGWSVRYRADVELPQLAAWRKKAADRAMPEGLDELKLCLTILANQCDALLKDGREVEDDDGQLVTFASAAFLELTGAGRAVEAVRRWYVIDGHVVAAAQEVMNASGYGEEAIREDPTPRS